MDILLHVCCGPCATSVVERLQKEGWKVVLFYFNPNTYPSHEFKRRKEHARKVAEYFKTEFICQDFDWRTSHKYWRDAVKGMEKEPEGGARCTVCYEYRLKKTAEYAVKNGFKTFTTTLAMGPMKDAKLINSIGSKIGKRHNLSFLSRNYRKGGWQERGIDLTKKLGLYRQNYCGCEFSMNR